jgi:hypothetical protein
MANRVCCLTRREMHEYITRDRLPDCFNCNRASENTGAHAHIDIKKAWRLVGEDDGTAEAVWVGSGCYMMFQARPKTWKGKDSVEYDGHERFRATRVMQMVEV